MSENNISNQPKIRVLYPPSKRSDRRELGPALRLMIIMIFGAIVAVVTSYLLRKIGF